MVLALINPASAKDMVAPFKVASTHAPTATMGISGSWSGPVFRSGHVLYVRTAFTRLPSGQYIGTYSSDTQAIMEYTFDSVAITGRRVTFVLGGGDLRFTGTARGQTISGHFDGNEGTGTFVLHRMTASVLPYHVQEVTFANAPSPSRVRSAFRRAQAVMRPLFFYKVPASKVDGELIDLLQIVSPAWELRRLRTINAAAEHPRATGER